MTGLTHDVAVVLNCSGSFGLFSEDNALGYLVKLSLILALLVQDASLGIAGPSRIL